MVTIKTIQEIVEDLDMTLKSEYFNQKWALVEEQRTEFYKMVAKINILDNLDIKLVNTILAEYEKKLFGE